ncbi:MAG: hypothetical protein AAF800_03995 [Planctomycetota bacterium]
MRALALTPALSRGERGQGIVGLGVLLVLASGCALVPGGVEPLPTVAWTDVEDARQILTERQASRGTVQARLTLRFTGPDGEASPRLDAALAGDGDGRLRLRAWKLGQSMFDLTATPDGVFVAARDEMRGSGDDPQRGLSGLTGRLGELLSGPDWQTATLSRVGGDLQAAWPDGLRAEVDGRTLTPRRFVVTTDDGESITVDTTWSAYATGPWYRTIAALGPFGEAELDFTGVTLGGALNPRAFVPPRRAVRVDTTQAATP